MIATIGYLLFAVCLPGILGLGIFVYLCINAPPAPAYMDEALNSPDEMREGRARISYDLGEGEPWEGTDAAAWRRARIGRTDKGDA